jgi:5S rRNA maturation endonuclease (ribonuclease M5)
LNATIAFVVEAEELTRSVPDIRGSAEAARLLHHLETNEDRIVSEVRDLLQAECERLRAQVETFTPWRLRIRPGRLMAVHNDEPEVVQLPSVRGHELIGRYDYNDEHDHLLFVVARYQNGREKTFRQWRNGGEEWVPLGDARRVPYRLPKILEHIAENKVDPIYVVEGENDVHAIEAAGGVATTNPMGAGKWTDDYADQLQGARRVIVVADRDDVGLAHAREVVASLATVGVAAELVQAAAGKDSSDHLDAGFTLDDFEPVLPEEGEESDDREHRPFLGLSHADVLALELEAERYLVEDLIPAGAVGTIAGVPETHKSFLAQAIAMRVAAGAGEILGRQVAVQTTVGYFWQDDSTREEAERVKLYETVHATPDPDALAIRWFLNEGLQLPRDLDRLCATIEQYGLGLVVLDSFYNFALGLDLKDEGPEQLVALLKREIADPTGCTILIVDHMPWATDTNRQRLRAYGGVFKSAATRFGIYIDAVGKKLSIEARGNNIRGFKKTPAYWDADTLELHLVDAGDHDEKVEERAELVAELLESAPRAHSKTAIRKAVGGRAEITDQALLVLKDTDRVIDLSQKRRDRPGHRQEGARLDRLYPCGKLRRWHPVPTLRDRAGQPRPAPYTCPTCPVPYRGTGGCRDRVRRARRSPGAPCRRAHHQRRSPRTPPPPPPDLPRRRSASVKRQAGLASLGNGAAQMPRATSMASVPRVALTPVEAAASIGVSRDFFDEHVKPELRVVRRGRLVLVPVEELRRWVEREAARPLGDG